MTCSRHDPTLLDFAKKETVCRENVWQQELTNLYIEISELNAHAIEDYRKMKIL